MKIEKTLPEIDIEKFKLQFILRHISQGTEGYDGVYRIDRWEYPIDAIREVVRNAIVHRAYALSGKDIKIAVFDDKIEITSPGKLMPSVDFSMMEAGQSESKKSYTPESGEKMSEKMSEETRVKTREKTREKILSNLNATPYITMNELTKIVGISKKGVEWQMAKLKKEGRIKRVGPDKGGYWDVMECAE